jgi:putative protein-disulfide isomerase
MMNISAPKPKIIYVGDPMCSWCYGFSPELQKLKNHYGETLDFEMIMGGLRPYNTETMTDLKDFLTHHWQEVNAASGQPFRFEILEDGNITYDTEPPCRASVVVRHLDASKEFDFFIKSQRAFYFHNKNMHLASSYHDILNDLNINIEDFERLFDSGFPTVFLEQDGRIIQITNGYTSAKAMITKVDKVVLN